MVRIRRLQVDKKGTYYLSIPIQYVKAMELSPKMKMSIEQVSKNELKVRKITEESMGDAV